MTTLQHNHTCVHQKTQHLATIPHHSIITSKCHHASMLNMGTDYTSSWNVECLPPKTGESASIFFILCYLGCSLAKLPACQNAQCNAQTSQSLEELPNYWIYSNYQMAMNNHTCIHVMIINIFHFTPQVIIYSSNMGSRSCNDCGLVMVVI